MVDKIKDFIVEELRNVDSVTEASIHQMQEELGIRYKVEVVKGPDTGRFYYLIAKHTKIGRGPSGIVLKDIDVSRLHASFDIQESGQVLVRDLGSTNGTYVNNLRVAEIALKSSDEIQVGTTTLVFLIEKISDSSSGG